MPTARRRLLWVSAIVVGIVVLINTSAGPRLLDAIFGIEWSAGITKFLRTQTQGLLILVGFAHLIEFAGWHTSKGETRVRDARLREMLESVLTVTPPELLVRAGLRAYHDEDVRALERLVISPRRPLQDVELLVRIENLTAATFTSLQELEFAWDGEPVLYALARDTLTAEALLNGIDELLECTVVVDARTPLSDFAAAIADHVDLRFLPSRRGPQGGTAVRLAELSQRSAAKMLRDAGIDPARALLMRGKMPTGPGRLRLRIRQEQELTIGGVWWMADRPQRMRQIRVEARELVAHGWSPTLHVFMGTNPNALSSVLAPGEWLLASDHWLVSGQGFYLAWRRELEAADVAARVDSVTQMGPISTGTDTTVAAHLPQSAGLASREVTDDADDRP